MIRRARLESDFLTRLSMTAVAFTWLLNITIYHILFASITQQFFSETGWVFILRNRMFCP